MKKISIFMIIIGIVIGTYPFMDRLHSWYWQQRAMKQYEILNNAFEEEVENLGQVEEEEIEIHRDAQHEEAEANVSLEIEEQEAHSGASNNIVENQSKSGDSGKGIKSPMGVLKIKKINLKQPILEGATPQNLKVALGHMSQTSGIGEAGNTAIAGHRSHTYGRFFNRLDELEAGDEIVVEVKDKSYTYIVYQKLIVDPTDISVLKANEHEKILTLITCHPLYKASHRLIIQAKIS